jgi:hypothetical protein
MTENEEKPTDRKTGLGHGCQIFLGTMYQNEKKYTKWP